MITIVTTATMNSLTSITAGSLTLIAVLTLIWLLMQNELISGLSASWALRMRRTINVAIVPLFVVFVTSVAIRVVDLLK